MNPTEKVIDPLLIICVITSDSVEKGGRHYHQRFRVKRVDVPPYHVNYWGHLTQGASWGLRCLGRDLKSAFVGGCEFVLFRGQRRPVSLVFQTNRLLGPKCEFWHPRKSDLCPLDVQLSLLRWSSHTAAFLPLMYSSVLLASGLRSGPGQRKIIKTASNMTCMNKHRATQEQINSFRVCASVTLRLTAVSLICVLSSDKKFRVAN